MGSVIGTITIPVSADLKQAQTSLASLRKFTESLDIGSGLYKSIQSAMNAVDKQLSKYEGKEFLRIGSENQLTKYREEIANIYSNINNIAVLAQNVKFSDLDTSKFTGDLQKAYQQVQLLTTAIQQASTTNFTSLLQSSKEIQTAFSAIGKDIRTLDASNVAKTLETGLSQVNKEIQNTETAIANLRKEYSRVESGKVEIISRSSNVRAINSGADQLLNNLNNIKLSDANLNNFKTTLETNFQTALAGLKFKDDGTVKTNIEQQLKQFLNSIDTNTTVTEITSKFETLSNALQAALSGVTNGGKLTANLAATFETLLRPEQEKINNEINNFQSNLQMRLSNILPKEQHGQSKTISEQFVQRLIGSGGLESAKEYLKAQFDQITSLYATKNQEIKTQLQNFTTEIEKLDKQLNALTQTKVNINKGQTAYTGLSDKQSEVIFTLQQRLAKVEAELQKSGNVTVDRIKNEGPSSDMIKLNQNQIDQLSIKAKQYSHELDKARQKESLLGQVGGIISRWVGVYAAVRYVTKAFQDMKKSIAEVDRTITNISIVTGMSSNSLWGQMDQYIAKAQKYAASISGVYEVSQLYYQQGLQTADVSRLTDETLKLATVSGLGYSEATNYMTNALRSFKLEMSDAATVTDTYSALAASAATSVSEIAIAMSKTASSAQAVGMTLQETAAMITVMTEATREAPENIGSALKSIISRYGELKEDPSKLIDSEGQELSYNKVDKALMSVGVTLKDSEGQFRNFSDVILELSAKWDTLDSTTQRYIATVMAGNRQQSRFLALVSSYERYQEELEIANDSEGAGTEQYLAYLDSIEARQTRLSNSWKNLFMTEGFQDTYKWILDAINGVIKGLNDIEKYGIGIWGVIAKVGTEFVAISTLVMNIFATIKARMASLTEQASTRSGFLSNIVKNGAVSKEDAPKIGLNTVPPEDKAVEDIAAKPIVKNVQLHVSDDGSLALTKERLETLPPEIQSTVTCRPDGTFTVTENTLKAMQGMNINTTLTLADNGSIIATFDQLSLLPSNINSNFIINDNNTITLTKEAVSSIPTNILSTFTLNDNGTLTLTRQQLQTIPSEILTKWGFLSDGTLEVTKAEIDSLKSTPIELNPNFSAITSSIQSISDQIMALGPTLNETLSSAATSSASALSAISGALNPTQQIANIAIGAVSTAAPGIGEGGMPTESKIDTGMIESAKQALTEYQAQIKAVQSSLSSLDMSKFGQDAANATMQAATEMQNLQGRAQEVIDALNNMSTASGPEDLASKAEIVREKVEQLQNQVNTTGAATTRMGATIRTSLQSAASGATSAGAATTNLRVKFEQLVAAIKKLKGGSEVLRELKIETENASESAGKLGIAFNTALGSSSFLSILILVGNKLGEINNGFKAVAGSIMLLAGAAALIRALKPALMTAKKGQDAFNAAANSNPYILIISLILAGISMVANAIKEASQAEQKHIDELNEKADEAKNKATASTSTAKSYQKEYKNLKKLSEARYDSEEDAKKFGETASKIYEELGEDATKLTVTYDEWGNAIFEISEYYAIVAEKAQEAADASMAAADAAIAAAKAQYNKDIKEAKNKTEREAAQSKLERVTQRENRLAAQALGKRYSTAAINEGTGNIFENNANAQSQLDYLLEQSYLKTKNGLSWENWSHSTAGRSAIISAMSNLEDLYYSHTAEQIENLNNLIIHRGEYTENEYRNMLTANDINPESAIGQYFMNLYTTEFSHFNDALNSRLSGINRSSREKRIYKIIQEADLVNENGIYGLSQPEAQRFLQGTDKIITQVNSGNISFATAQSLVEQRLQLLRAISNNENLTTEQKNAAQQAVLLYDGTYESLIAMNEGFEEAGITMNEAGQEALNSINMLTPHNLVSSINTAMSRIAESLKIIKEDFDGLANGIEFEKISEWITKYNLSYDDFEFKDGKFFVKDAVTVAQTMFNSYMSQAEEDYEQILTVGRKLNSTSIPTYDSETSRDLSFLFNTSTTPNGLMTTNQRFGLPKNLLQAQLTVYSAIDNVELTGSAFTTWLQNTDAQWEAWANAVNEADLTDKDYQAFADMTDLSFQEAKTMLQELGSLYKTWKDLEIDQNFMDYVRETYGEASQQYELLLDQVKYYQAQSFIKAGRVSDWINSNEILKQWVDTRKDGLAELTGLIAKGDWVAIRKIMGEDVFQEFNKYLPLLQDTFKDVTKTVYDSAIKSVTEGQQIISVNDLNKDALRAMGGVDARTQGAITDTTTNAIIDLSSKSAEKLREYGQVILNTTTGAVQKELMDAFNIALANKSAYHGFKDVIDNFTGFSYSVAANLVESVVRKITNYAEATVQSLVDEGFFEFDESTGLYTIGNISAFEEMLSTSGLNTKLYNQLYEQLDAAKWTQNLNNHVQALLKSYSKITVAMLSNIANLLPTVLPVDSLLPGGAAADVLGLIPNGDNTYRLPLTKIKSLLNLFYDEIPEEIEKSLDDIYDEILTSITNIPTSMTKGFTKLTDMQKYWDLLQAEGLLSGITQLVGDAQTSLFTWDDTIHAYVFSTQGLMAQMQYIYATWDELDEYQKEYSIQLAKDNARQLAAKVDLKKYLSGERTQADWDALWFNIEQYLNYVSIIDDYVEEYRNEALYSQRRMKVAQLESVTAEIDKLYQAQNQAIGTSIKSSEDIARLQKVVDQTDNLAEARDLGKKISVLMTTRDEANEIIRTSQSNLQTLLTIQTELYSDISQIDQQISRDAYTDLSTWTKDSIKNTIEAGGKAAIYLAKLFSDAAGTNLSQADLTTIYRAGISKLVDNVKDWAGITVGSIVDSTVATFLQQGDNGFEFDQELADVGLYVVTKVGDLTEAYRNYYNKLQVSLGATTKEINDAAAKILEVSSEFGNNEQIAIDALQNATSMTYEQLANLFTSAGQYFNEAIFRAYVDSGIIKVLGGNKIAIMDFATLAEELRLQVGSEEYVSAFNTYNDSLISMNQQAEQNILNEVKALSNAKRGDWINLTYLINGIQSVIQAQVDKENEAIRHRNELRFNEWKETRNIAPHTFDQEKLLTSKDVTERYDNVINELNKSLGNYFSYIENGILHLDENANLYQVISTIIDTSKEYGLLLDSQIAELSDTLVSIMRTYTETIKKGLQGTLSNQDVQEMRIWAEENFGIRNLRFEETANGFKLAADSAMKLYTNMRNINGLQADIVFDELVTQLQSSNSELATIAGVQEKILSLKKQISDLENASNNAEQKKLVLLQSELAIYEQMASYMQLNQPDSYKIFDSSKISNGIQGFVNFADSISSMDQIMAKAGETGQMGLTDYLAWAQGCQEIADATGQTLTVAGWTFEAGVDRYDELVGAAANHLIEVDGKTAVDISGGLDLNLDFSDANSNISSNDAVIKAYAQRQIALLDDAIAVLEVMAAMEKLGDLDVNGDNEITLQDNLIINGDFDERVSNGTQAVWEYANATDERIEAFKAIQINEHTLYEILDHLQQGDYDWFVAEKFSDQQITEILNAMFQMGNWDGDPNDIPALENWLLHLFEGTHLRVNAGQIDADFEANIDWHNPRAKQLLNDLLDGGMFEDEVTARNAITAAARSVAEGTATTFDEALVAAYQGNGSYNPRTHMFELMFKDGAKVEWNGDMGDTVAAKRYKKAIQASALTTLDWIRNTQDIIYDKTADRFYAAKHQDIKIGEDYILDEERTALFNSAADIEVSVSEKGDLIWTNSALPGQTFSSEDAMWEAIYKDLYHGNEKTYKLDTTFKSTLDLSDSRYSLSLSNATYQMLDEKVQQALKDAWLRQDTETMVTILGKYGINAEGKNFAEIGESLGFETHVVDLDFMDPGLPDSISTLLNLIQTGATIEINYSVEDLVHRLPSLSGEAIYNLHKLMPKASFWDNILPKFDWEQDAAAAAKAIEQAKQDYGWNTETWQQEMIKQIQASSVNLNQGMGTYISTIFGGMETSAAQVGTNLGAAASAVSAGAGTLGSAFSSASGAITTGGGAASFALGVAGGIAGWGITTGGLGTIRYFNQAGESIQGSLSGVGNDISNSTAVPDALGSVGGAIGTATSSAAGAISDNNDIPGALETAGDDINKKDNAVPGALGTVGTKIGEDTSIPGALDAAGNHIGEDKSVPNALGAAGADIGAAASAVADAGDEASGAGEEFKGAGSQANTAGGQFGSAGGAANTAGGQFGDAGGTANTAGGQFGEAGKTANTAGQDFGNAGGAAKATKVDVESLGGAASSAAKALKEIYLNGGRPTGSSIIQTDKEMRTVEAINALFGEETQISFTEEEGQRHLVYSGGKPVAAGQRQIITTYGLDYTEQQEMVWVDANGEVYRQPLTKVSKSGNKRYASYATEDGGQGYYILDPYGKVIGQQQFTPEQVAGKEAERAAVNAAESNARIQGETEAYNAAYEQFLRERAERIQKLRSGDREALGLEEGREILGTFSDSSGNVVHYTNDGKRIIVNEQGIITEKDIFSTGNTFVPSGSTYDYDNAIMMLALRGYDFNALSERDQKILREHAGISENHVGFATIAGHKYQFSNGSVVQQQNDQREVDFSGVEVSSPTLQLGAINFEGINPDILRTALVDAGIDVSEGELQWPADFSTGMEWMQALLNSSVSFNLNGKPITVGEVTRQALEGVYYPLDTYDMHTSHWLDDRPGKRDSIPESDKEWYPLVDEYIKQYQGEYKNILGLESWFAPYMSGARHKVTGINILDYLINPDSYGTSYGVIGKKTPVEGGYIIRSTTLKDIETITDLGYDFRSASGAYGGAHIPTGKFFESEDYNKVWNSDAQKAIVGAIISHSDLKDGETIFDPNTFVTQFDNQFKDSPIVQVLQQDYAGGAIPENFTWSDVSAYVQSGLGEIRYDKNQNAYVYEIGFKNEGESVVLETGKLNVTKDGSIVLEQRTAGGGNVAEVESATATTLLTYEEALTSFNKLLNNMTFQQPVKPNQEQRDILTQGLQSWLNESSFDDGQYYTGSKYTLDENNEDLFGRNLTQLNGAMTALLNIDRSNYAEGEAGEIEYNQDLAAAYGGVIAALNELNPEDETDAMMLLNTSMSAVAGDTQDFATKLTILQSKFSSIDVPQNFQYTVTFTVRTEGEAEVAGNKEFSSTITAAKGQNNFAFSGGKSTLVGELGPEMIVSNGRYFIVGQNGAEFVNLDKDAIVFNHLQTKRLLNTGHGGRGKPITNEREATSFATGNVNLNNRPIIPGWQMFAAGWREFEDDYATLYSSTFIPEFEADAKIVMNVTPITADGKVLTPQALESYVYDYLYANGHTIDEILELDASALGLVINLDEFTGDPELAAEQFGEIAGQIHEEQAELYDSQAINIDTSGASQNIENLILNIDQLWNKINSVKGANITVGINAGNVNSGATAAKGRGTLMGELGPELVVSNGRYFVVGQNGAEFVNLASDAIVFNHLQTQRLLANGFSGRGKAVTNERNATSFAKGNVSGPALASASSALSTLKALRDMWKNIAEKGLSEFAQQAGGGGGGGGGGKNDAFIADLDRWYNLMREIDRLEKSITYQETLRSKLESDRVINGKAYYESQKESIKLLEDEIAKKHELIILQKQYYDARRKDLEASKFGEFIVYDEHGHLQHTDAYYKKLGDLMAQNGDSSAKYTAEQQYNMLKSWGFEQYMRYDTSGKEIELKDGEGYATAVQAFWDKLEKWQEELDELYDGFTEYQNDALDLEDKQNQILQEFIDNQVSLENRIEKAIEDARQREIDEARSQKDAIQKSSEDFIQGLTDALDKERKLYEDSQTANELNRQRRQLAILQRSGGSASQIRSLQQDIASKEQDQYFNAQQDQIDTIQKASDAEMKKMEQQISIMEESLKYEKEHGLLWQQVSDIMAGTPEEIESFLLENSKDLEGKSTLQIAEDLRSIKSEIEQWIGYRDDENNPVNAEGVHNWNSYYTAAQSAYSLDEKNDATIINAAKAAYDKEYAESGDENAAARAADEIFWKQFGDRPGAHAVAENTGTASPRKKTGGGPSGGPGGNRNSNTGTIRIAIIADGKTYGSNTITRPVGQYIVTRADATEIAPTGFIVTKVLKPTVTVEKDKTVSGPVMFCSSKNSQSETAGKQNWRITGTDASGNNHTQDFHALTNTEARSAFLRVYPGGKIMSVKQFKKGGLANYTGFAMVHGSKQDPEAFLNADETHMWRDKILSGNSGSLTSMLIDFQDMVSGMVSSDNYSEIGLKGSGINIENATVNMNATISNDYDARRAADTVMEEMVRIARKTTAQQARR